MPAGAKMSMASMKAEPMMPNMSVTPLATMVSTKASEGVMRVGPLTTVRVSVGVSCSSMSPAALAGYEFMENGTPLHSDFWNVKHFMAKKTPKVNKNTQNIFCYLSKIEYDRKP
jgi:hypothetical protein